MSTQGFPMLFFAACGGWEKRRVRGHLALRQRASRPLQSPFDENWKALDVNLFPLMKAFPHSLPGDHKVQSNHPTDSIIFVQEYCKG